MATVGKLCRANEAALLFGVSVETVQRWIKRRKIQAMRLPGAVTESPRAKSRRW